MSYDAPKYPRVKFENDARRKLTVENIAEIKSLRKQGWSYKGIGELFGVSAPTAHYHADPEFAKALNKKRYKLLKEQLAADPELKKQRNYEFNQRFLERARNDPEVREFKVKHTYKWKKKKYHTDEDFKAKTRKQAKDKYYKDKLVGKEPRKKKGIR